MEIYSADLVSGSFSGSFEGIIEATASHAISASYAVSASHEIIQEVSSSYAESASYAETSQTSSVSSNTRDNSTLSFWQGTQAQYDALGSYDSDTIYITI